MALKQLTLVALVALSLGACEENRYRGSARHHIPIPAATYALMSEKGMSKDQPILIRSYKKESELEVWKRKANGQYALLKTYPMCRWSGQLGPKIREGDRMAPEGFYAISPAQMNPNSAYYVSFNMGYPNAYDRAHGRTGAHLMVHGACSSAGCYSMTDDQMGEIYALVREAHNGGQRTVQMQALPFRMTPENLAKHRLDSNIAFWKNLKEGTDYFEVTGDEPQVAVNGGRYVFNGNGDPSVVQAVQRKRQQDETQVAALVAKGTPAIKLIYDDGDQHGTFKRTLVASGSDTLNRAASWGSRDVGVSRPDALTVGPRVVVLDDKGKAKATIRAESADNEVVLAAVAAAAAKPEPATSEPAKPEPARAAAPAATTQLARVQPGAATAAPVTTGSFGTASAESEPFYRRALSFVPLIGAPGGSQASAPVASVVPATPTEVVAPLPPRRTDRLRTTRLDQPAAAFSSQPTTR
ncbi:MAG TPA: murein L,D-transpeptidase family protein [Bosea sp. (in: a-proteobacteria)]|uniref:murein L,D-transpeptidase family protein n=1 Tax=Bosea sp. (in: a-proteobacteria) TaxID=1871050 RepID=UPI002DDD1748|nr:murein L,D-transpeptidase family protein [Bosea sp. (in: a-proteobacteria)]HEV2554348.1 murein L,D-transpeptidase family protein [Bosea sp. (in: a-proteobacteria)]